MLAGTNANTRLQRLLQLRREARRWPSWRYPPTVVQGRKDYCGRRRVSPTPCRSGKGGESKRDCPKRRQGAAEDTYPQQSNRYLEFADDHYK